MQWDYSHTYWNGEGKHKSEAIKLAALIPGEGEVENAADYPMLERYRALANLYYDLYNNGGCNRAKEIAEAVGEHYSTDDDDEDGEYLPEYLWNKIAPMFESLMDETILAATAEQEE